MDCLLIRRRFNGLWLWNVRDVSPNFEANHTELNSTLDRNILLHEFYSCASSWLKWFDTPIKFRRRYDRTVRNINTWKWLTVTLGFRTFVQFIPFHRHPLDTSAIGSLCHGFRSGRSTRLRVALILECRSMLNLIYVTLLDLHLIASIVFCSICIPFHSILLFILFYSIFWSAFMSHWFTFGHRFHYIGLIN